MPGLAPGSLQRPWRLEIRHYPNPIVCKRNCTDVCSTSSPYFTLRRRLIKEASGKYFVVEMIVAKTEIPIPRSLYRDFMRHILPGEGVR